MPTKHVVLRSNRRSTRDVFLGPLAGPQEVESIAAGLKIDVEELAPTDVDTLSKHADVVAVAPTIPMKLVEPFTDGVQPAAGAASWGIAAVGADTSPFTGAGVVVAVLDTGIDAAHAAFAGMTLVQQDFTGDGNGDQHGHGTHCAGTVFGRDVDGTRIGVARGVKKALIGKVIGQQGGASDAIVRAIQWAVDNGAHVISMSLGIDFPGYVADLQQQGLPVELATSRALEGYRANVQLFERLAALIRAQSAFQQPTLMVAAAGNESRRDLDPQFRIAVSPPAVAEGVLSVAALGQGAQGFTVARFSNTGANVAAPGVQIVSAKAGGGLQAMSGTSMATPHVAGVTALWAEKVSSLAPLGGLQLTARVVASAGLTGLAPNVDPVDVGAGLVQAPQQ